MKCSFCGKDFNASKVQEDLNGNKYCSVGCYIDMITGQRQNDRK